MSRLLILVYVVCAVLIYTTVAQDNANNAADDSASETAVKSTKYVTADGIPKCDQKSANLSECLKYALENGIRRYTDGDEDLNLPSLDPFHLNRTTLQFSYGVVKGHVTIRNVEVKGFAKETFETVDLQINKDKFQVHVIALVPQVQFNGYYKADIVVNNVHLKPKGVFNVTLTNLKLDQHADGVFYEKDGHRFMRISNFDLDPEIGDLKAKATGVFPDPQLNEIAVNMLNQYWKDIFRIGFPATKRFWMPMLLEVMNQGFSVVPFDEFVTDST